MFRLLLTESRHPFHISCAPFFAGSPYPVNECPVVRFHFASLRLLKFPSAALAFPFSFVSSPRRFAFWRSASLVWKRASFNTPARAKQSASGSAVRFNYLAASQVVDAGWFTHFVSNLYNIDRWKFPPGEKRVFLIRVKKRINDLNSNQLKLLNIKVTFPINNINNNSNVW